MRQPRHVPFETHLTAAVVRAGAVAWQEAGRPDPGGRVRSSLLGAALAIGDAQALLESFAEECGRGVGIPAASVTGRVGAALSAPLPGDLTHGTLVRMAGDLRGSGIEGGAAIAALVEASAARLLVLRRSLDAFSRASAAGAGPEDLAAVASAGLGVASVPEPASEVAEPAYGFRP